MKTAMAGSLVFSASGRSKQPWLTTQIMMVTLDILAPKLLPENGEAKKKRYPEACQLPRDNTRMCAYTRRSKRSVQFTKVTPHLSPVRTVEAPADP